MTLGRIALADTRHQPRATVLGQFAVVVIIACLATRVSACEVPVFRYALERWEADRYEAIVFHHGPLHETQREQLSHLDGTSAPATPANLDVTLVDTAEPLEPDLAELWTSRGADNANGEPWLIVRGPYISEIRPIVWSGQLDAFDPQQIVTSPARDELIQRVLAGDSAVWLVLAIEDNVEAANAYELLSTELERLGDELPLPEGIGQPGSEVYSPIPLTLRFSVLRVSTDDPRERWLTDSLQATAQIADTHTPLVVPVFGRGRALQIIPAGEVTAGLIEDMSRFVSSACSCQVKEQNPGIDLLLAVDWQHKLFEEDFIPPPGDPLPGQRPPEPILAAVPLGVIDAFADESIVVAEPSPAAADSPTETPAKAPASPSPHNPPLATSGNSTLIGGTLLVTLAIAGLFIVLTRMGSPGR